MTTSTSIIVSWSINKEDIVFTYELQYTYIIKECQRSSDIMKITFAGSANSYILENLEEDSDFTISLVAINPAGRSEAASVNVTTLQSGKIIHYILTQYKVMQLSFTCTCSSNWVTSSLQYFFIQLH